VLIVWPGCPDDIGGVRIGEEALYAPLVCRSNSSNSAHCGNVSAFRTVKDVSLGQKEEKGKKLTPGLNLGFPKNILMTLE
jgi:hypothetical protein